MLIWVKAEPLYLQVRNSQRYRDYLCAISSIVYSISFSYCPEILLPTPSTKCKSILISNLGAVRHLGFRQLHGLWRPISRRGTKLQQNRTNRDKLL